jgi:hypothetical protein
MDVEPPSDGRFQDRFINEDNTINDYVQIELNGQTIEFCARKNPIEKLKTTYHDHLDCNNPELYYYRYFTLSYTNSITFYLLHFYDYREHGARTAYVRGVPYNMHVTESFKLKEEWLHMDHDKYPKFMMLTNIFETMCNKPTAHYLFAHVVEENVRFLLLKENGIITKHYEKVPFSETLEHWPHFSWSSLKEIELDFLCSAGLVYVKGSTLPSQQDAQEPVRKFLRVLKGISELFTVINIFLLILFFRRWPDPGRR